MLHGHHAVIIDTPAAGFGCSEMTEAVPGRKGASQRSWAFHFDVTRTDRGLPLDPSHVPLHEPFGFGRDDKILLVPWMLQADFTAPSLEKEPESVLPFEIPKVEAHNDAL